MLPANWLVLPSPSMNATVMIARVNMPAQAAAAIVGRRAEVPGGGHPAPAHRGGVVVAGRVLVRVGVHDDGPDYVRNDINRGTFNTQIHLKFDRSTKCQSTDNW